MSHNHKMAILPQSTCKELGAKNFVRFFINGTVYTVSQCDNFNPDSKLVDFIRDVAFLKGTKYMCREGGCGACVVTIHHHDSESNKYKTLAANSCLIPIFACDGWEISTIESVGNKRKGYHPIQKQMVAYDATQCGFCTPGQIMSMHSLLETKSNATVNDVESVLDGNLCRCTGYRSILDAFKSFAVDAPKSFYQQPDIEDCVNPCVIKEKTYCPALKASSQSIYLELHSGQKWVKVSDIESALVVLKAFEAEGNDIRIVAGNTGPGVFRSAPAQYYLDISGVRELLVQSVNMIEVVIGGAVTLTVAIKFLETIAENNDSYKYMKRMSKHLQRVANTPVRNIGTLGGNLMLKNKHRQFPSDVFLLLATIGARLTIVSRSKIPKMYTMKDFLMMDMNGKLIVSIHFPQKKGNYHFRSFKVAGRFQNGHAFVNAGFLMKVDKKENFQVQEKPSIVYGGISPNFIHASDTENFLVGKYLGNQLTLQGALKVLDKEINPNQQPGAPTPLYRKSLTKSLFYKTALEIIRETAVSNRVLSGMTDIVPGTSKGIQVYDKDNADGSLYKPVPKLEAETQASGETEYINDIPFLENELSGAYVLTTVGNAEIDAIDTSEAMGMDGVIAFVTAKDIPGINDYMIAYFEAALLANRTEPIFVDKMVQWAGQPVGLLVAKSRELAIFAASKVKITYKNVQKPVLKLREALSKIEQDGELESHTLSTFEVNNTTSADKVPVTHEISGEFEIGSQYSFHLETQCCICYPKEDSMDVISGTQFIMHTQAMVAAALGKPNNYVNVQVRRLGGAFGSKITRAAFVATSCAVAAYVTNQPVRVIMDFETNMEMIGKRPPYLNRYKVSFDDNGKIHKLRVSSISDAGVSENEAEVTYVLLFLQNAYQVRDWKGSAVFVNTNTPAPTFVRAPGNSTGIAVIEYIIEHIAFELKMDPLVVRQANYIQDGDVFYSGEETFKGENLFPKMIEEIKMSANYEQRKKSAEKFNRDNRWKKKGLAVVPSAFYMRLKDSNVHGTYAAYIAVYHIDGTISVSHAGIEMGQGINTKVAQAVATTFQVPLELVQIKASNSLLSNNSFWTGGSVTSEICCNAAVRACKDLLERMAPIKETLGGRASWKELVAASYKEGIDLSASHMFGPRDHFESYITWAVNITEMEVDILTGEYKAVRVDIVEDVGKSLNPRIDIGQIEGGYLMGQGLWTMEKIIYDDNTGQLLTNRTWNYKVPASKDIPEDFRVTLMHNGFNSGGVLGTKALGEPPLCTAVAVLFALRNAIASARMDVGHTDWFQIDGPVTPEDVLRYSMTSSSQFIY